MQANEKQANEKPEGFRRVLSFDASTKTIGVSVIDYKEHWVTGLPQIGLVHSEAYSPPRKGNILARLHAVREKIAEYIATWEPDDVALEEIMLFMQGKSNAKTITSLAVLNRTVGLAIFDLMGKPPEMLHVSSIRASLKINDQRPKKEDMPDIVAHHLGITFPWIMDKKGKIAVESYDMADGIAVGLAFIVLNSAEKKPRKTSKKKTTRAKKPKRRKDGYS